MALVNHAKKEINAKLVYYGPADSGKGAVLRYIYSRIKPVLRGELKHVPAGGDNLLFFDFSPFETPLADGYRLRLHVYTLTGLVKNPATWKMTLKGADGLVIMVNPAAERLLQARESVSQLRDLLSAYGVGVQDIPVVLQSDCSETEISDDGLSQLSSALDLHGLTACRCNAASGEGVLDVLSALVRQVLERISDADQKPATAGDVERPLYEEGDESASSNEPEENLSGAPLAAPSEKTELSSDISEIPRISIAADSVAVEGTVLRIPLDIVCGDTCRRLVITVSADVLS